MKFLDQYPFLNAWFGAAVLYLLNLLNSRQPFSVFVAVENGTGYVPSKRTWLMVVLDLIISSAIGGVAVMQIWHPVSASEALLGGLGLTGIFSAFGKDA
jgi:hypothetical protein